ncbi:MAG: antibiotic biosynthesis monooxygenase [Novosphingobium sp.]|nr:antibiotic biosynthesis monooxygenase [Novosphingobium sp.]MCP5400984.1 antibiotic biosynthesis monooxygenase [Novosphingobium sp.]
MAEKENWGLLGRMVAKPGKRDELIAALQESSRDVPGKLVYLIQLEQDDPDAFWINEVWADKASYDACLTMPQVGRGMEAIQSLVAGMEHRTETVPLGDFD